MRQSSKLVVITRTTAGNRSWQKQLEAQGLLVYCLPTIETVALPLTTELSSVLNHLAEYDWLILTSATSARFMQKLAEQAGLRLPTQDIRVAAVGEQTARAARAAGLRVAFRPSKADSATLCAEIPPVQGSHILIPRTTIASEELAVALESRGARVTSLPIYETRTIDTPDTNFTELLRDNLVGYLTFASPSAVRGFSKRVTAPYMQKAHQLPAIAIGHSVAVALSSAGFQQVHVSGTPTIDGIIKTLRQLIGYSNS